MDKWTRVSGIHGSSFEMMQNMPTGNLIFIFTKLDPQLEPLGPTRDNVHAARVQAHAVAHKGVGPADIQRGDADEAAGVVDARLLVHLSGNGHRGVHWVGPRPSNQTREGLGGGVQRM